MIFHLDQESIPFRFQVKLDFATIWTNYFCVIREGAQGQRDMFVDLPSFENFQRCYD